MGMVLGITIRSIPFQIQRDLRDVRWMFGMKTANCYTKKLKMNYKIIQDENLLKSFIDWLPDLEPNEVFYCCLFARKKYCPELVFSSDKTQLKRFTAMKTTLFDKIRQLECPIGSYRLKDRDVPQEALVLYINPNPRDLIRASYESIKSLTTCLQNKSQGFNPHQEVLSCIQRAKSRTVYFDVDIDEPDADRLANTIAWIESWINPDCLTFVKTRGGCHCLIEVDKIKKEYSKTWHKNITSLSNVDQTSDQLLPVVGCCQGGFVPFLYFSDL